MEGLTLDPVLVDTLLRFPGELRAPINNQTAALSPGPVVQCSTWNQINHLETGPTQPRTVLRTLPRVIQSRSQDTISRGSGEVSQPLGNISSNAERREGEVIIIIAWGQNTNDRPPLHRALCRSSGVVRINLSTVPWVAPDRSLGKILFTEGEGRSKTLRKGGLLHCGGGSCLSRTFYDLAQARKHFFSNILIELNNLSGNVFKVFKVKTLIHNAVER